MGAPEDDNFDRPVRETQPRGDLFQDILISSELIFENKLTWLLILGPIALLGDATKSLGEAACFALSGIALIPCAERLSYVTEQVAAHTNGTIGALLNATFGNAPELLISTAALRSGFYRVVQLTMLGSMLTNLLFVFGISCLVGGLRWQVQELRITSGNVSVGMLLLSTAGSLLPAGLVLTSQLRIDKEVDENLPSKEELQLCRFNAFVMVTMYICYLIFQLGTHKEEFDEEENIVESAAGNQLHLSPHFTSIHGRQKHARPNFFCMKLMSGMREDNGNNLLPVGDDLGDVEMSRRVAFRKKKDRNSDRSLPNVDYGEDSSNIANESSESSAGEQSDLLSHDDLDTGLLENGYHDHLSSALHRGDSIAGSEDSSSYTGTGGTASRRRAMNKARSERRKQFKARQANKQSRQLKASPSDENIQTPVTDALEPNHVTEKQMSFRAGIVWLFIITLCISAMSDILVDTIDGFALRMHLSEVFTSMVVVPFFSNVAEQVSAVLFAYRNEMDLCVGVTVGSAIQVATFVLPGCVLIGMFVDRSMTLYFHGYETMCMFLAVIVVAAVLQGGTTNWLVGMTLIGIYVMIAAGIWFHELEDLSVDAELAINNSTRF